MSARAATRETPASYEEAAAILRRCSESGTRVRPLGGGTKRDWGGTGDGFDLALSTAGLDRIVEHNEGDLTAVLAAGAPLRAVQDSFARAGQRLALDPPLGEGHAATVGGAIATGDSGPLRHRYGAARDLVLGMTFALADGTLAKSGGKVIKNVAGYDLGKLLAGLHPVAEAHATVRSPSADPSELGRRAGLLSHSHLEMESLDVAWSGGAGEVLARFAGAAAQDQAVDAAKLLADADVVEDDGEIWRRQRDAQRWDAGTVVRVSGLQAELPRVLREAESAGASVIGRAALGISWLRIEGLDDESAAAAARQLRSTLAPSPCVVLDAPPGVRSLLDVWGESDPGLLALTRRVKERFDPQRIMSPGVFVGGI
jgi:glycolate oxidase FAD binding subunit